MVNVVIEAVGIRGFGVSLDSFGANLTNLQPAFERIAGYQAAEWRQQFATQGGHFGGGWAPLSPNYRKWKAARFPGQPILVRTGRLRRSLTQRPFGIEEFGRNTVRLGTDVPYAQFHQRGTAYMPRRQIFQSGPDPRRVKTMARIMQQWILKGQV